SQQPAEPSRARVSFPTAAAFRGANGEPDLIGSNRAIHPLQHEIEVEPELQLSDHDDRRTVAAKSDEVAAADLALHLEPKGLEEPLYRSIERSLQALAPSPGVDSLSHRSESPEIAVLRGWSPGLVP